MLTILVPVYNEKKYISKIIRKLINLRGIKKQIIIIDDGSSDGTTNILKKNFLKNNKINKIIFHTHNKGKGAAIKSAQKFIRGKYVVIQDADLEYNPNDLIKLYKHIKTINSQVLYGSRVLGKSKFQNTKNFIHLMRIWANYFLTVISNLINNQNLTDAHTCYKVFNSKLFKKITLSENGFAFCPEVTTKISNLNINIYEIPISYKGRTYKEGKKISSLDGLRALYSLIKYKFIG